MNDTKHKNITLFRSVCFFLLVSLPAILLGCADSESDAVAIPFASDGHLKMFYDIRMHPSAIEHEGNIYITWRGNEGLPQAISYNLEDRKFSNQVSVYESIEESFELGGYITDQHYNPAIWRAKDGYFHIIAGCHGLLSFDVNGCDKVKSRLPNDIASGWLPWSDEITSSINYPNITTAYNDQTLFYFRDGGHLGSWTYRLSPNGETDWTGPDHSVVDLNAGAHPDVSCLDFYAGSYNNSRLSQDGRTLHIAFVWQQEVGSLDVWPEELQDNNCALPINERYADFHVPQGRTRYNLYYLAVDIESGIVTNHLGNPLETPVTRSNADNNAKILDTNERLFSVPPSIHFDEDGQPQFLGVISDESPNSGWFTHIRLVNGEWYESKIAHASNVWNSGILDKNSDGNLRALLVVNDGEIEAQGTTVGTDLNRYAWGDRIEEWISRDEGDSWELNRDITPQTGLRYQNLRTVSTEIGEYSKELFLIYGWEPNAMPGQALAFLLDDRP
ncbi:MAG: BNR-4 repeat-containing protein [Gammaproteobacteria bacterium]|nr:BNR-4 repeat-containing protein [Gammaproteobacteria bacterium]